MKAAHSLAAREDGDAESNKFVLKHAQQRVEADLEKYLNNSIDKKCRGRHHWSVAARASMDHLIDSLELLKAKAMTLGENLDKKLFEPPPAERTAW